MSAAAPSGLDLETATIQELDRLLETGKLTSVELSSLYLKRIDSLNLRGPSLNAIRSINPSWRVEAQASDRLRAAGTDLGPMMGMPVLIKDNIDVKGLPTTAGSVALADNYPAADAPVVTQLRAAGAVILGKTNLAEFAYYMTSGAPNGYSSMGGQVLNPFEAALNTGGSSSGSGSAMAIGMAAGTVGSDTGGSILQPSHTMSLIGVRPTVGLLSRSGVVPISGTNDTTGPMTHTVYDAAAMLTAMTTGVEPGDPTTADAGGFDSTDYTKALSDTALQGARLGYVPVATPTVTLGQLSLYERALQRLRDQGATLVPVSITSANLPTRVWDWEFKKDLNTYLSKTPSTTTARTLADVIAYNKVHADVALKFGQTLLEQSQAIDLTDQASTARYEQLRVDGLAEARRRIDTTLSDNNITAIVFAGQSGNTSVARAAYPAVMARSGYEPENRRPYGLEFVGTKYTEATLLSYAYDYEEAASIRTSPSTLNPTLYRCTDLPGSSQEGCVDIGDSSPAGGFALRVSPVSVAVPQGGTVRLAVRLVRSDGSWVSGAKVGLYTRPRGGSEFVLSRRLVTDAQGLAATTFSPSDDFRWYARYDVNAATVGARSAGGLVQVRR